MFQSFVVQGPFLLYLNGINGQQKSVCSLSEVEGGNKWDNKIASTENVHTVHDQDIRRTPGENAI